jgi:hypothetical protein
MELLDRYLQAVRFWLPKGQQDDIIAELSEDIRSQIDEREAALGRKINEGELAEILKQRGRPLVVANRYLPQQALIGPALFPTYKLVLKIVALCYSIPWILTEIGLLAFDAKYRADYGILGGLERIWRPFLSEIFFAFAVVTIVFAVLERLQAKNKFLDHWDPLKLPAYRDRNRITRFNSAIDLAANLVFLVWWGSNMSSQTIFDREGVRITLSSASHTYYWAFFAFALANIVFAAWNLFRPYWTVSRASMRFGLTAGISAVVCWACKANLFAELVAPNISAAQAAEFVNKLNAAFSACFPIAVMACVLVLGFSDVRRLVRARQRQSIEALNQLSHSS